MRIALELLDKFDCHTSAKSLWNSAKRGFPVYCAPDYDPSSALHCISHFGVAKAANVLIKISRWDVNQGDNAEMTPLIWAARYGHDEVVRLLLREKHIRPDRQDTGCGRTELSWTAENGHEGVVGLFLGPRFVNPRNIGLRWGKTPRVVGLLFGKRYINPNNSDWHGRTALSRAAGNGHEGIAKLLLGRGDVNPDTPDAWYGQTPLSRAAGNDHGGDSGAAAGAERCQPP